MAAGTLSPVSADSSICSALAVDDAPVGRHLVPGGDEHDVADDQLLGGDLRLVPSRRTRAVAFIIDLSAFIALSALPSWRRPDHRVQHRQQSSSTAVLHSLITSDTTAAPTRMICM